MKSYIGAGVQYSDPHHTGKPRKLEQIDDGRWHHRFGASWLKTTDLCLERARLEHERSLDDWETDAASVGTSVHAAIEAVLENRDIGVDLTLSDMLEIFHMDFSFAVEDPRFRWVKYTEKSARAFGEACVRGWWDTVLPGLPQHGIMERRFILPFVDDSSRLIELSGAIDYIGDRPEDWKTSSRGEYEPWEYRRWGLQPTVYTWAANELGLIHRNENDKFEFRFNVMHRYGVQQFQVERDERDWEWLRMKVERIADLIETGHTPWPVNDNHALCSPVWCPAWSECKGKALGPNPWNQRIKEN